MALLIHQTQNIQASENTKYHCLYGYYFLKMAKDELKTVYNKSKRTIERWIEKYNSTGSCSRKEREENSENSKFTPEHTKWIVNLYVEHPLYYLEEAQREFKRHFGLDISVSTICRILAKNGLTWKTVERRAVQVRNEEIAFFHNEVTAFHWDYSSLLFLDEVSFDNLGLLRKRGYAVKGGKLYHKGEFVRKPRVSMLCFMTQDGLIEHTSTRGTFTRQIFFDACRMMALSGKVKKYPGYGSIWIMDGAKIHCSPYIISYLRSLGILPIFLPSYCPFFNPIEVLFGLVKRYLRKTNFENSKVPLEIRICEGLRRFSNYDCTGLFRKCGYFANGTFIPAVGLAQSLKSVGFKD